MILEIHIGDEHDDDPHDEMQIIIEQLDELELEDEIDDITLQDVNSVERHQNLHIIDDDEDDDGGEETLDVHIDGLHEDEVLDIYEELQIELQLNDEQLQMLIDVLI